MELHQICPADITVGDGRREADPERVAALAESMRAIGLKTPISVYTPDDGETVRLIAGRHRLEAAKLLQWSMIDCVVEDMTDRQRRLWEISENLHRAELTVLERDECRAEWMRLSAEEDAERISRQLDEKIPRGRPAGGRSEAARAIGISEPAARRAEAIAALVPEAKMEAKALGLDNNQTALLAAAKGPSKEQQVRVLREHAAKRAAGKTDITASEQRIESAVNAVKRLSPEELLVFADWFDGYRAEAGATVFDHTAAGLRVVS